MLLSFFIIAAASNRDNMRVSVELIQWASAAEYITVVMAIAALSGHPSVVLKLLLLPTEDHQQWPYAARSD